MGKTLWNDEQEKPLQHLRILDLTVMLPGPYLTRVLAQYGAEVIKIEAYPGGDPVRSMTNTALSDWLTQGKKSVAINLRTPEGRDLVRQLSQEVDVVVENFREGVMDAMGLGYAELTQNNPELLYFSLRGFAGKNASRPGHDLNFVAASGCGEWFLENGPNYACHWGDIVGGTLVPLTKLLAHLSNPDRRGMQLVSYMDEGFRSLFLDRAYDMVKAESLPHADRTRYGTHHFFNGTQPHSQYYRCEDGAWVALNAVQQKHWDTFCDGVGKPEWKEKQTDKNLSAEVTALFQGQPASYWEALFAGKEVCLFKVLSWEEHLMESASRLQILRDPLNWAGFAPHALGPTPALGEDTFSVVQELGIGVATFGQYMKEGIIYQPEAPGRTSK